MASLLLPIIYLAFISLGLPDALLGAAWPTMYPQLGAQVSWAGGVSMIISACTILSALASDRLNERLGTGRVTAISAATTAAALFGFSFCHAFWQLCLWAIPYGLGAGSVDAALNNYVALHYKSRHMSWLHCMWGVGASLGPVIMGQALAGSGWQGGYRIIGILQVVLTVVLLFSLPLWKLPQDAMGGAPFTPQHRSFPELLKITGVPEVLVCFLCYCALESTAGMWASSYCTLVRGLDAQTRCQLGQPVLFGHYRRAVCFRLFDDEDERPQHDPAGAGVNCPGHSAGSAACRKQRAVCGPDFDRLGLRPCLPLHHPRNAGQFWPGAEHVDDGVTDGLCLCGLLPGPAAVRPAGTERYPQAVPLVPSRWAGGHGHHV